MKYFAYGSNMDLLQMAVRCPGATVIGTALLPGFAFRINRHGVATVVPEDRKVYGVLWEITARDERNLDGYEGVSAGFYSKAKVQVWLLDGRQAESLAYIATEDQPGEAWPGYLETIVEAARLHRLPTEYIAELEGCGSVAGRGNTVLK